MSVVGARPFTFVDQKKNQQKYQKFKFINQIKKIKGICKVTLNFFVSNLKQAEMGTQEFIEVKCGQVEVRLKTKPNNMSITAEE